MARDFEDIHNIEQMDDRELRDLVREQLEAHNGLDIDDIVVQVEDGAIMLSGRVGTDGERRIADHILADVTDNIDDAHVGCGHFRSHQAGP